jgi:hypothetical protein
MVCLTTNIEIKFGICNKFTHTVIKLYEGVLADGDVSLDANNCGGSSS